MSVMPIDSSAVNPGPGIAPLTNVMLFSALVRRVQERARGLPGMAAFTGPSGFGKSFAAAYAANKHRAYYVQMKSVWTRKYFCTAILKNEMGITPAPTIPEMIEQIGQQLALSRRPLIIDEADFLVQRNMIEIIRDIYESSAAGILLIGESNMTQALERWERVHSRLIDAPTAAAATLADARHLARIYAPGIEIADDLLIAVHEAAQGSVRRICVNLDKIREHGQTAGLRQVGVAQFPGPMFVGAGRGR